MLVIMPIIMPVLVIMLVVMLMLVVVNDERDSLSRENNSNF